MQALGVDQRVDRVLPFLEQAGLVSTPVCDTARARTRSVVAAAGDRLKVAGDILDYPEFFLDDDTFEYDQKAFAKRLGKEGAVPRLERFRDRLRELPTFGAADLEQALHAFVEAEGIKIGQIIHAVRVAVTGKAVGFGLFEGLAILGREACLRRIDRALTQTSATES